MIAMGPSESGQDRSGFWLGIGTTVVTLVALAGVLLWLAWPGGVPPGTKSAARARRTESDHAQGMESAVVSPQALVAQAVPTHETDQSSVYLYLVDSAEMAEALRTLGESSRARIMLVVEPADEERLLRALADGDAVRHGLGRGGLTLIDLRTQTGGPARDSGVDVLEPAR
jgi:hypothetical protein